ncbi:MAG TPA: hypothetical protein VGC39_09100 [Candidatus Methylacidiphilales bacterium]
MKTLLSLACATLLPVTVFAQTTTPTSPGSPATNAGAGSNTSGAFSPPGPIPPPAIPGAGAVYAPSHSVGTGITPIAPSSVGTGTTLPTQPTAPGVGTSAVGVGTGH